MFAVLTFSLLLSGTTLLGGGNYVNEKERARVERIIAPFLAGDVPPMKPSNAEDHTECERPKKYKQWKKWQRVNPVKYNTRARILTYHFNRLLNVLENRDCSCDGQSVDIRHVEELVSLLPTSELDGVKVVSAEFYFRYITHALDPLVEKFCGHLL
ncbi:hypothetical protein [Leisingera sp. JC1]|uniref:hypothetical protein n=1 Tax=Leisingera sp. JC1 TaxID=1855282 RepID=UPI001C2FAB07|nr:hypothetical protein [Leisingera sp. JC1]